MKYFAIRRLIKMCWISGLLGVSTSAMASAFQLWEQDGASIGNFHAGYAALANDASTAFYNPAGMTRIKNQQLVLGAVGIMTDFKYKGDMTVNTIDAGNTILPVTAQGGNFSFLPALHYVAPICDRASFGFSVDVPFGLKTNYGNKTILRYAATLTSTTVVDVSPSLAFQVTDKSSIGFGLDVQRMFGEFDQVGTIGGEADASSTNKANDTAYGYHLGWLYQFTPDTRVGLSYHSQVVHHLTGTSRFEGELTDFIGDGPIFSDHANVDITLPAYTALSFYHLVQPKLAVMASVIYTQWNTFRNLVLNNVAGINEDLDPSTTIQVVVPEYYRNTWNVSVGADYYATDKITLKAGAGLDQTPVRDDYRNVQLPDNDRYVMALGGHYQATKTVGFDLSWAHVFINRAKINPPPQVTGAQIVTTTGGVMGGADVFGAQLTWDIV